MLDNTAIHLPTKTTAISKQRIAAIIAVMALATACEEGANPPGQEGSGLPFSTPDSTDGGKSDWANDTTWNQLPPDGWNDDAGTASDSGSATAGSSSAEGAEAIHSTGEELPDGATPSQTDAPSEAPTSGGAQPDDKGPGRDEPTTEAGGAIDGSDTTFVRFTRPTDGASVPNPVSFAVEASDDVSRVAYFADDWKLDESTDTSGGFEISYEFYSIGLREIVAKAYDDSGAEIATDTIEIQITGEARADEDAGGGSTGGSSTGGSSIDDDPVDDGTLYELSILRADIPETDFVWDALNLGDTRKPDVYAVVRVGDDGDEYTTARADDTFAPFWNEVVTVGTYSAFLGTTVFVDLYDYDMTDDDDPIAGCYFDIAAGDFGEMTWWISCTGSTVYFSLSAK